LAQLLFGVDIGSKYTKVAVLEHGVKTRLVNGFLFPTPLIAGKDGDKQVDPELFLKAISSFIPVASLVHAKIAVNLPTMSITALSVYLPLMSRKELSYAAINEAKQKMIPVSGPNHTFDCLFLGETMINKIPRAEVLVIRTENFYVQRIVDIFKSLEEHPVLISPASTILPNILPKEAWRKDRAVVIVDIGAAYLKISICSDAHMVFMRNIVFGLEDITQDFARQLSISPAAAEKVIKEQGVPVVPFDPKDKVAIAEEIMRQKYEASLASPEVPEAQVNLLELRLLWQPHIERIVQELRRSFVFYNERSEGRKIEELFFIGGGSYIKNLRTILSSFVGGECKEVLPFAQIPSELTIDNQFKDEIISSAIFASAASLAFGIQLKKQVKEAQINFLPVGLKQKEATAAKRMIALIIGICFISVFVLAAVQMFLSNQMVKWNIRAVEKKLSKVKRVSEDLKVMGKYQGKIEEINRQISDLAQSRPDFTGPLKDLLKVIPEEIVLSKCLFTGNKVELEGRIFADYEQAQKSVADFKNGLAKTGYFTNLAVPAISLETISPELSSGGGQEELRLTQAKDRGFKLSAEVAVPKTLVLGSQLMADTLKSAGQEEKALTATVKTPVPGAKVENTGGTPDNPQPVHGSKPSVLSADKTGRKVKKRKVE
jgi:type IV pilus assembly protein PilM